MFDRHATSKIVAECTAFKHMQEMKQAVWEVTEEISIQEKKRLSNKQKVGFHEPACLAVPPRRPVLDYVVD